MKKRTFIFILIILYAGILFPQAVDIQLTATDGSCPPMLVKYGLDLAATDCLDPELGEISAPSPPPGVFDVRFDLSFLGCPPNTTTSLDYRAPGNPPSFPFTGIIQHRLIWQKYSSELPVDITYNLPARASMTIVDEFGGIFLNLGPFYGQGATQIPGSYLLNSAFLVMHYHNIAMEPAVNIPLLVTDGTANIAVAVGLDLTATTCIDSILGEFVFNVFPPAGVFDVKLDLAPYGCGEILYTLKDYRPPGDPPAFPYTGTVQHTLGWQKSAAGLPVDITYNLPWGATMTVVDLFGGIFLNLGPFIGQGTATIPGTYPFSRALLIIEYNNIVPVEFTSFSASVLQNEEAVQLSWTTATETNNSGFEIQRSEIRGQPAGGEVSPEGGKSEWRPIGFVPGFGTTTERKSYSFVNNNVTTGIYKYRLKQIDFDGTFTYSNEIEVAVDYTPKEFVLYQNYPNPFNPTTTIKFVLPEAGNVTLTIYNTLGQKVAELVNSKLEAGNYSYQWNAKKAATGIYIYDLRAGVFNSTKKMLLLK